MGNGRFNRQSDGFVSEKVRGFAGNGLRGVFVCVFFHRRESSLTRDLERLKVRQGQMTLSPAPARCLTAAYDAGRPTAYAATSTLI